MIREEEKRSGLAVKIADKLIKHSSLTVQSDHYHKVNKTLTKSWDSNFPRTFNDTPDDNNNNNQGIYKQRNQSISFIVFWFTCNHNNTVPYPLIEII